MRKWNKQLTKHNETKWELEWRESEYIEIEMSFGI